MARRIPTYRLYGEESGARDDFWLHCESLPERSRLHNWEIAEHRHAGFFQIFLVSAGRGELRSGESMEAFQAPCALFMPPDAAHGFRFTPDVDGLVVTVRADRLASLCAADRRIAQFAVAPRMLTLEDSEVEATVRRIATESSLRTAASGVLLDALLTVAVVELARAAGDRSREPGMPEGRDAGRISQLEALVATHFREHRPVEFFADRIGVSTTHLNRIARTVTGSTVQDLLANRLIDQARRDLVFTPTPVQAIAYSLGFSDPAYFNRFFRKHAGTTPGRFRASERLRSLGA